MRHPELGILFPLLTSLVFSPSAGADAPPPLPSYCPAGTDAYGDHHFSGCRPDRPSDCPAGYEPRVRITRHDRAGAADFVAYCEPPAAIACPTGSREHSAGPNLPTCVAANRCDNDGICGSNYHCRASSLCMNPSSETGHAERDPRFPPDLQVFSACEVDSDCEDRQVCAVADRCDAHAHRVDPEGQTLDAILRPLPTDWLPIVGRMGVVLTLATIIGAAVYWRRRRRRRRRG